VSGSLDYGKLDAVALIAFDIDGVFTDGRFYLSDDGVESKAFHTQDGYGVRRLIRTGFEVAVISGRKSNAVTLRMEELGVQHVILGAGDKVAAMETLLIKLGLTPAQCAFVGDDLPDLPLLRFAGLSVAVANAVENVKTCCDYVTGASGGFGAVREIADLLCDRRAAANSR